MPPGLDLPLALAALVGVALVLLPGLASGALLGLRGLGLVALAGPLSIAIVGTGGVLLAVVGVSFSALSVAGFALLAVALSGGIGLLLRVGRRPAEPDPVGVPIVAMGVSAIAMGLFVLAQLPRPDAVSQSYDAVFHLNAAASILENGDASSFHLYRLTSPGDRVEFYPAAWHSLVALAAELTGSGVERATTAVWIATSGAIWIPGAVWLADLVFGRFGRRFPRTPLRVAAALLGAGFAAFPYGLLDFGTLYPSGLAYALMPAGLGILVVLRRRIARWAGDADAPPPDPVLLRPWLLAACWLLAQAFAHPRALFGFAVLAVPLLASDGIGWARRRVREPGGRRVVTIGVGGTLLAILLAGAGALTAALVYFDAASRPISERLNGGPARADQSLPEAILQVLGAGPVTRGGDALWPSLGVALLVLLGAVLALRRGPARWIVVSFAAVGVLYVLAATSDSDLAKILTGAWYKDKFRLSALLPIAALPLAAAASAWLVAASAAIRPRLARVAAVAAGAILVVALAVPTMSGLGGSLRALFELPRADKHGLLIDEELHALLADDVPRFVPAGERVAGNPWNGSTLSWAVADREPLFPHLVGRWDRDRRIVAERLDEAGSDPEVCEALDRLDTRYVIDDDQLLGNGNHQAEAFAGIDRAVEGEVLEEVAAVGSARLYRITACD